jgi:hypothetical protein
MTDLISRVRSATVGVETAQVFRGGGRRWFTRQAAERAEARKAWKRVCECDESRPAEGYPGYTCTVHADPGKYQRRVRLYAAMFVRPILIAKGRDGA